MRIMSQQTAIEHAKHVLGHNDQFTTSFVEDALQYLGHETKTLGKNAIMVDGESLVYADKYMSLGDFNMACRLAAANRASRVFAVKAGFFGYVYAEDISELERKHGVDMTVYSFLNVAHTVHAIAKNAGSRQ